jgi:hypothetical protein
MTKEKRDEIHDRIAKGIDELGEKEVAGLKEVADLLGEKEVAGLQLPTPIRRLAYAIEATFWVAKARGQISSYVVDERK